MLQPAGGMKKYKISISLKARAAFFENVNFGSNPK
jgi:hypothetical protein